MTIISVTHCQVNILYSLSLLKSFFFFDPQDDSNAFNQFHEDISHTGMAAFQVTICLGISTFRIVTEGTLRNSFALFVSRCLESVQKVAYLYCF